MLADFSGGSSTSSVPVGGGKEPVERRQSRSMNDPLPPVPPVSGSGHPLPQPPRPPSLLHSPTQSHASSRSSDSNRHSLLMHRKHMMQKQQSVVVCVLF